MSTMSDLDLALKPHLEAIAKIFIEETKKCTPAGVVVNDTAVWQMLDVVNLEDEVMDYVQLMLSDNHTDEL